MTEPSWENAFSSVLRGLGLFGREQIFGVGSVVVFLGVRNGMKRGGYLFTQVTFSSPVSEEGAFFIPTLGEKHPTLIPPLHPPPSTHSS